ncbi:PTS sugar transporter subunit IIA [Nigerium massiliense]|uniref:PTS sugar transporter subunit IIA n=1 Tax=Nigerium massiliense TaxID=1522317 RepID=UPI00058DA1AE|nr:PTS glucose transporter subunit IIA [Nigerium massiliense]
MTDVVAPCPGRILPIGEVDDPVFSGQMLGPGVGIEPSGGRTTTVAPIGGKVVKIMPHAFVVLGDDGVGILTHLGINTVGLKGEGFEVVGTEGSTVAAGDPMVTWDPSSITGDTISTTVIVVAMDRKPDTADIVADGDVAAGDVLFRVG